MSSDDQKDEAYQNPDSGTPRKRPAGRDQPDRRQDIVSVEPDKNRREQIREIGQRVIAKHQEALRLFEEYDRGEIRLSGRPQRHGPSQPTQQHEKGQK